MKNERPLIDSPTPWWTVAGFAVALALVVTLLVVAFSWPAFRVAPRDLPLAVAGPETAVAQVTAALDRAEPDGFEVRPVADEAAARDLIVDREVYGALVAAPDGSFELLVASAASPTVSQLLTQAASALGSASGGSSGPTVTDVVPNSADDPRGAGLAAGSLPLTLGGVLTGSIMALRVRGRWRRATGATLVAILTGPAVIGVLHGWLGAFQGDVLVESGLVGLGLLAGAMTVIAGHALLGYRGLGLAAATLVLLGNPLSAASSAPELLPRGWRELGQSLPPGALVDAMRGVSGFDGAGATRPTLILAAWVAGGVAVVALSMLRRPKGEHRDRSLAATADQREPGMATTSPSSTPPMSSTNPSTTSP